MSTLRSAKRGDLARDGIDSRVSQSEPSTETRKLEARYGVSLGKRSARLITNKIFS